MGLEVLVEITSFASGISKAFLIDCTIKNYLGSTAMPVEKVSLGGSYFC